jgi:hypothetical protein
MTSIELEGASFTQLRKLRFFDHIGRAALLDPNLPVLETDFAAMPPARVERVLHFAFLSIRRVDSQLAPHFL